MAGDEPGVTGDRRRARTSRGRHVGSGWQGGAAEAFHEHWNELHSAVRETGPQFEEVAAQLDEAADAIEEINEAIHQIYLEIGVSVAVSVGLSFVTMGFSTAAGAAQAARLVARLGSILRKVASALRALKKLRTMDRMRKITQRGMAWARTNRLAKSTLVNSAGNVGGNVMSDIIDNGRVDSLGEDVWKGVVGGAFGTPAGKAVGGLIPSKLSSDMADGVTGNVTGGLAADGINAAIKNNNADPKDDIDGVDFLASFTGNALGGAAGGALSHGARELIPTEIVRDGAPGWNTVPISDVNAPSVAIDAPISGVTGGNVNGALARLQEALEGKEDDKNQHTAKD